MTFNLLNQNFLFLREEKTDVFSDDAPCTSGAPTFKIKGKNFDKDLKFDDHILTRPDQLLLAEVKLF